MKKVILCLMLVSVLLLSACATYKESSVNEVELGNGMMLEISAVPANEKTELFFLLKTDNSVFESGCLSDELDLKENYNTKFLTTVLKSKKTGEEMTAEIGSENNSLIFDISVDRLEEFELQYCFNAVLNVKEDKTITFAEDKTVEILLPDNHKITFSEENNSKNEKVIMANQDYKNLFYELCYRLESGHHNPINQTSQENNGLTKIYEFPVGEKEVVIDTIYYHKAFEGNVDLA